jgi:RHS repeat-associated protein
MKRKPIIALVLGVGITSTAFADFNAPLPEFKISKQLVEWRAEMAARSGAKPTATHETRFYTGKPYLASSGNYAFKFRSYNPELARWTSEDPSGFPDGANQNRYAPSPTRELDYEGLVTLAVTDDGNGVAGNDENASSDWAWTILHNGVVAGSGHSEVNQTAKYVNKHIGEFAGLTLRNGIVGQSYTFSFMEAYNFKYHDQSVTFNKNTTETYATNQYGDWRNTGWSVTAVCFDVFGNGNYNDLNKNPAVNDGVKLLSNSNIGGGISSYLKIQHC